LACSFGGFEFKVGQVLLPAAAQAFGMSLGERRGSLERVRRAKVQGVR